MSTKLLASTKYWHQQNVGADKILASTKYGHQRTPGIAKILVSTKSWGQQKDVADSKESSYCLAIRVHNCWLIPDLAEDLLCLPDGVALFACSGQVWCCLQTPCFHGRSLSRTEPAYCTSLPCWKRHKFWLRQNISVHLKFTDFRQTTAVCISAHRHPIKKWWKHKVITITVQFQFLHSQPQY